MLAAFSGQLGSVQELRRHGADPRLTDRGGSTAFHWAVDSGHLVHGRQNCTAKSRIGLWTAELGRGQQDWTIDSTHWAVDSGTGPWTAHTGPWTAHTGPWTAGTGCSLRG